MTNEEINDLTDKQINVMVTKCAHDAHEYKLNVHGTNLYKISNSAICGVSVIAVKDYCNDQAVMWPIIVEAGISIIKHEDYNAFAAFVAAEIDDAENDIWMMADHRADDINPLRAAAIVYLKIKGALL